MAKEKKTTKGEYLSTAMSEEDNSTERDYCSLPEIPAREFSADVSPIRVSAINGFSNKWANGTLLRYYFFDKPTDGRNVLLVNGETEFRPWATTENEKQIVREGFKVWKQLGIGLEFKETNSRDEAEIRIGFERGDGAWSYLGREILNRGRDVRTMNFGWDLTQRRDGLDTATHEIGHTLGFDHEHQNPNSGIVWDEEAVYAALAQPPNRWNREKTFYNIIRKIPPSEVEGTTWDPNSIMHYPFNKGLIRQPEQYRLLGLTPAGGLSEKDRSWTRTLYPPLGPNDYTELRLMQSTPLPGESGQQANFLIKPDATRHYDIRVFGQSDVVMVLFEENNGELRYRAGNDDSGTPTNASLNIKLIKDSKYVLRVRMYYTERTGENAVMIW